MPHQATHAIVVSILLRRSMLAGLLIRASARPDPR
jgi:hypothetical protein